ncbi:MAG: [NiFe]-hydrogenase assembly chaperone HybE [Ghiorsea sp.]|nr:[NiFe]-hydrogenase assembly chaperone HybE [Ghiorsea sp.]MDQ7057539.1 [NiFe]-hydrogenase assembly chaperone HybE [Ghiorsea sp.]
MLLKSLTPMGAAYHLEQLYDDIRVNRMADIPILNDKIKVQAVGFREWNHHVLGALITPWFMNLMLLPTEETDWSTYGVGTKHSYTFEAGLFEFIVGEEENLGKYMSCSMFSPMFEFADHDAAVQTAEAIVTGMFNAENKEELVGESMSPSDELVVAADNETGLTETMLEGAQTIGSIAKENLEKPLSRRELLRGGLFRKKVKQDKGEESD